MFTSNKQDYETPYNIFKYLNDIFKFECDLFADKDNALCEKYFSKENSALGNEWYNSNFANPPYDSKIQYEAFRIAYHCAKHQGKTTVMLVPARTDTARFHDFVFPYNHVDIIFLKGRLKFSDSEIQLRFLVV